MRTNSISGWALLLAAEVVVAAGLAVMTPTLVPLAAVGIAAGLLVVIFMPRWAAAALLILVLPPYDYSFFTIGQSTDFQCLEVGVLVALAKWALDGVRERRLYFDVTAFEVPVVLVLGYAAVTLFWAPAESRGIHQGIRIAEGFTVYFLHVNLIRDRRDFERALSAWVLMGVVIAYSAFVYVETTSIPATAGLQITEGDITQLHKVVRVTMFFTTPNSLAFTLCISAVIVFIRYYWARSIFKKLFFGGTIMVMMMVLAATFSRKSWLAIALALGIVGLRFPRILVEGALAIVVGVLAIILSDTAHYSDALYQRFMSLFIDADVSISERMIAWQIAIGLFYKSPLLGNGLGGFYTTALRMGQPQQMLLPHSFYVYLLSDVGLVGLSLVGILAVHFAWALWTAMARITEPYMNFVATLLFGLLLSILFQAAFRTIGLTDALFWGPLGLMAAFVRVMAAEGRAALPGRPKEDQPVEAPPVRAVRVA